MDGIVMKKCSCCGKEKPTEDFYRDKNRKDGLCFYCKKCMNVKSKKYRPLVTGYIKPRSVVMKDKSRQDMIVKYGIDVVEAMDSIEDY